MYIRETLTRRIANKTYRSVRLVKSRRVGARCMDCSSTSEQAFLFGSNGPNWLRSLKQSLPGMSSSSSPPLNWRQLRRALCRDCEGRELDKPTDESLDGDTAHIKLDSVEMDNARSVGSERLALGSLEALGLPGVLKDVGLSDRDARIAMALVVARMIHPSSEREALRWLETNSATL